MALTDHARAFFVKIGIVQGGTHGNMVPAECRAVCYALVPTAAEEAALRAAARALPRHDADVRAEVTAGLGRPPFAKTPAIQALFDHAAALAADCGLPSAGERAAGGGSDGNFTGALGIPTLDGLGAIGGGPRTREEHIDLRCRVPRTRLLARLFATLGPGLGGL
jgi:glutamate carboxypeptidase